SRGFSFTRVRVAADVAGAQLTDSHACAECHPNVASQWQKSAHRFSSFDNPIYRARVDRFREARGYEASQFCCGCHDLALLVDGALAAPVSHDAPRAQAGIGCVACHGMAEATLDGNASYALAG